MKTLHKQIEKKFNEQFTGHPSREEQFAIEDVKWAILKLAQAIDDLTPHPNNDDTKRIYR